jgi:peptide-methionine (R)-S-oxide reductase
VETKVQKSEEEWKHELTPEQYEVLRRQGTEPPFTGRYVYSKEDGIYRYEPAAAGRVELRPDHSHGMVRTEVVCARCGSHLGHVFDDGPAPTGQRYCINSLSLDLDTASSSDPGDAEGR